MQFIEDSYDEMNMHLIEKNYDERGSISYSQYRREWVHKKKWESRGYKEEVGKERDM